MKRYRVGVVGCGKISEQYLNCLKSFFPGVIELAACADLAIEAAKSRAEQFGIPKVMKPEELLADPEIEVVLNLTNPWAHAEVNRAVLESGKHVYVEKPLALAREDTEPLLGYAEEHGLRIGCAPDTFLGAGLQMARKVIDEGWIGRPLAAHAFIMMRQNSQRYNSAAVGGAIMDMGPYYLTALVHLFGPVRRVAGFTERPVDRIRVEELVSPNYGEEYPIEAPMAVSGTLEFDDGVTATLTTISNGFTYLPQLEIYGTDGHLVASDPNMFSGPLVVRRAGGESFELPVMHRYRERNRGLGLADMVFAIEKDRPHRASGRLAFHVLDVLLSLKESAADGRYRTIESTVERPAPLVPGEAINPLDQ